MTYHCIEPFYLHVKFFPDCIRRMEAFEWMVQERGRVRLIVKRITESLTLREAYLVWVCRGFQGLGLECCPAQLMP